MRVRVHFIDGELMDGSSDAVTLSKSGFPIVPDDGNNDLVWVSLSSLKYVAIYAGNVEPSDSGDPREGKGLQKAVVRFSDGETIRTYRDDSWGQDGEGFALRVWDPKARCLVRVLVSMHGVKGIFFVREWDSRTDAERLKFAHRKPAARASEKPKGAVGLPAPPVLEGPLAELATRYRRRLAEIGDRTLASGTPTAFAQAVRRHIPALLREDEVHLSAEDLDALIGSILQFAFGYGVLDPLLLDPGVTEVMVNGAHEIFVEREGKLQAAPHSFESNMALMEVIKKMAASAGRRIDESSPMVDARLPDGSRLNAVIPPAAVDGPFLTIRRFAPTFRTLEELVKEGTLGAKAALFLRDAVLGRANMVISGGTGSGKTTTLNVLGSLIPAEQRVVTIEDTAELQLSHPHVVRLEYRPPNIEGRGELTIRHLLRNSLRMRPDRIVIGEVRSAEVFDMLQAMNTGHDGSITTVHANSARDALVRLETMAPTAYADIPLDAVRGQIASAIDLVIHQARRPDGRRRVVQIAEVAGYGPNGPVIHPLYVTDDDSRGELIPTGLLPRCLAKLSLYGVDSDPSLFIAEEADGATRLESAPSA